MHKLNLYLNDDQYKQLSQLAKSAGRDTAEEYANEIFYSELRSKCLITHPELFDQLLSDRYGEAESDTFPKAPACPICGEDMVCDGRESFFNEAYCYECEACNTQARLSPSPKHPCNCFAEFSKGPMYIEVRRRDDLEKPGFKISGYIYTCDDVVEVAILEREQENVTFQDLCQLVTDAFKAYLPFAERFSTEAVKAALKEYIEQLSSSH